MRYSTNKDVDALVRQLVREGWTHHWGSKHGRLLAPDGKNIVIISNSPSDCRSFQNFRRDLRKVLKDMRPAAPDDKMCS